MEDTVEVILLALVPICGIEMLGDVLRQHLFLYGSPYKKASIGRVVRDKAREIIPDP